MNYIRTFHCFHGTIMEAFSKIKEKKQFIYQKRANHWLGNGVYFFLDDREKATWWAETIAKRHKTTPCIIYIKAIAQNEDVLDLNTENGQRTFYSFITYLEEKGIAFQTRGEYVTEEERKHHFRCSVMDLLTKTKEFKASCYLFPNTSKPYLFDDLEHYGIMNNKGNQLCVYDQTILEFASFEKVE